MKYFSWLLMIAVIGFLAFMVMRVQNPQIGQQPASQENQADNFQASPESPTLKTSEPDEKEVFVNKVNLTTEKGVIVLNLFSDKAPNTVKNFLEKVKSGFYEGLTFHRVEDWVVQGGDPDGNGAGGGEMPTELNDDPFAVGSLGVARGNDIKVSNDSQFFICKKDCGWLTSQYTNFGQVLEGMDIVQKLEIGDKILRIEIVEE